jgi:uncharacterized Zn finger protein
LRVAGGLDQRDSGADLDAFPRLAGRQRHIRCLDRGRGHADLPHGGAAKPGLGGRHFVCAERQFREHVVARVISRCLAAQVRVHTGYSDLSRGNGRARGVEHRALDRAPKRLRAAYRGVATTATQNKKIVYALLTWSGPPKNPTFRVVQQARQAVRFRIMRNVPNDLARAMNDAVIRRLAGAQSYQRGLDYFSHGHVESLEDEDEQIRAVVRGNQDYTVMLSADDGMLDYSCDCPVGSDGAFCKHCVAAALAWLNRAARPSRGKKKQLSLADARQFLQTEDKDTLVQMVLDWAKDDERLRERIVFYAARRSGPDTIAAAVRRAFQKAIRVRGYTGYREARTWARAVDGAIDSIEQLLNDGQAAAVIELCESALQSLLDAIRAVDDSDGHFSTLRDRLEALHYRACEEAPPDRAELAKRLFESELHCDFDIFYGAAERYAGILGAKGMQVYRELAEAEWQKVPVRTAKDKGSDSIQHYRITRIMESVAKASNDVEQRVAVMSRDLSSAYDYWLIAEVYREARQHDNALLWAENGLKAFPAQTDVRLREFAAKEYHRRGRHHDAMKLMWAAFSERLGLETYKALEEHAKKADAWPEWRERALAQIRLAIAKTKRQTRPSWLLFQADNSLVVEVFLYENNPEEAWREAQAGGCSDRLWLRLAGVREKEHPEDAAPIYLKQAEAGLPTGNGSYEDSVELLMKAAAAMQRADCGAEFARHLEALRLKYKAKRNFLKLIEQNRKSLYLS